MVKGRLAMAVVCRRLLCASQAPSELCTAVTCSLQRHNSSDTTSGQFLAAMRNVPSPVVVVTASHEGVKRGVTCSSFTSVSRQPPIISFSMQSPSKMHSMLSAAQHFAVHVLSASQAHYSVHFSRPASNQFDQFHSIPHTLSTRGVPILADVCAVLQCEGHTVHTIGDHNVWYGKVLSAAVANDRNPLLYYARSYRSVGDDTFMKSFEDATLGYEQWTHEAHLRMGWNYITAHGIEQATPLIKSGIQKYIERNKGKVKTVYNETVTLFYIHMINKAIAEFGGRVHSFEEFLAANTHLQRSDIISKFYSHTTIDSSTAREKWVQPDLQSLP